MVNLLYAVAAFTCALVVLLLPARTRKNLDKNDPVDKAFLRLVDWTFIFCVCDALWGVAASSLYMNDTALTVMSYVFHATAAFTPLIWLNFFFSYKGYVKHKRLYRILTDILFLLEIILLASNAWTDCIFYLDEEGAYHSGVLRKYLFYAQYLTYILMAVSTIFKLLASAKEDKYKNYALLAFVAAPILCGVFQLLFPDAPAYSIGYSLGCCIIYSFVLTELLQSRMEAKIKADEANKAKTDFLFNMSHDIRTPMNAIIGFTTIARHNAGNTEKVADCLNKIDSSGKHLLNLINEVLDMSRIEAGKLRSDLVPLNVKEAAERMMTVNQETAERAGVKLSFSLGDIPHPEVLADELHVNQIVMNILGNAIKYTMPGGSVNYSMKEVPSDVAGYGKYAITVEDTGIGMSEEFLTRIFDSFSREETKVVSGIQGTGLGMSIVKRLVDFLDGTIEITSKQGHGTKVTVTLPMKTAEAEETAAEGSAQQADLSGRKVLLVEDNDLNREIAAFLLADKGMIVDEARNGREAVSKVRTNGADYYDCLLMDIQMPFMNGYEATAEIRKLPGAKKLIIIALSANAFAEDRRKSISAGMNDHLAKPIDMTDLVSMLSKYLN